LRCFGDACAPQKIFCGIYAQRSKPVIFFRWIVGLPFAALITAGLFMLMAGLIQRPSLDLAEPQEAAKIQILAKERAPLEPLPTKPTELVKDPPETIIPPVPAQGKPKGVPVGPTRQKNPVDLTRDRGRIGTPVIKHAPPYPEACRSRAAEGGVLIQFDVTPEGGVVNIQILQSADSCFNRTVRRTVAKWKYPPAYRNGRPITRYGVIERFSFRLTD
jgi:periplasmic protein TonB